MKKIITIYIVFLYLSMGLTMAQTINLEEVDQEPILNAARNGSVALGDIDNDGDLDLFVLGETQNPTSLKGSLYENDGAGNYTEILGTPFVGMQFGYSAFIDVDNDGDQDLLTTGGGYSSVVFANLYLNDGSGNFSLTATSLQGSTGGEFAFEDVDNDGDQDLLITGQPSISFTNSGQATLYLNNGVGVFSEVMGTPFEAVRSSSVAFGDIDNDNDKDVIISGRNDDDLRVANVYTNDGSGNFTLIPNTTIIGFDTGDIAIADADNDGDNDVLVCGTEDNVTKVTKLYTNDGTGTFSLVIGTPFLATFTGTVDFVDFDNDGDDEVLLTGSVQGAEFASNIYENQGGNNFVLVDSLEDVYFSNTAIGDINGDNNLDAVIVGIGSGFDPLVYLNSTTVNPLDAFELSLKVFLEGAYDDNGTMRTDLTALIPNNQPYNSAPWFYTGSENVVMFPSDVVDWVLVEARTGTPNLTGNPGTTVVETIAGLLLADGSVIGADGTPIRFVNLTNGTDYYFAIRHRNHLDVLTATTITASPFMTYDFSTSTTMAFGVQQQKTTIDGNAILYAGDASIDNVIQVTDYDLWADQPAALNVYQATDFNLDGVIQATDYDVWFANKAKLGIGEF